jgi:hypothetical protein
MNSTPDHGRIWVLPLERVCEGRPDGEHHELEEYKILLATADFRFTNLTPTATPFSLIEAVAA